MKNKKQDKQLEKLLFEVYDKGVKQQDCNLTECIEKIKQALRIHDVVGRSEQLNPEFAIGEQVLLTKRTVVTIETFCEDGMIEIDDNNEYYKVDKDELSKRV